ncbi:MAG: hypothetical protein IK057_00720 [Clostridia bacterium]|nr:hypothetical protein [Clostridia bacterium]
MKKLRNILIFILFFIYAGGVLAGAVREVKMPNASEMYEYLEKGIEEYDTAATSGVKTAAMDNLKTFSMLVIGSLFKPFIWLMAVAMLIKGYFTGFSVMAALRLYGIRGILLCVPNILSAMVLIPASIYYGGLNGSGLLNRYEKSGFYKKFLWATIFLLAIFCADTLIKGAASPIFVKWASKLFKAA